MYIPLKPDEETLREKFLVNALSISCDLSAAAYSLGLPFFHTCKGQHFRGIFTTKRLKPLECPEFKENILYLFYGKPAYRVSSTGLISRDIGRFPVCFVVKRESVSEVKRVFPFDTGAMIKNVMSDVCGKEVNPAKYELGSNLEAARRFIAFFYGSDRHYFLSEPKITQQDIGAFSFELQHLYALVTEKSEKKWDNRAYTVEAQCGNEIVLNGENIEAIIMPSCYMNTEAVADFFYNQSINVLTYSLDRADPNHMSTYLIGLVEEYFQNAGLI